MISWYWVKSFLDPFLCIAELLALFNSDGSLAVLHDSPKISYMSSITLNLTCLSFIASTLSNLIVFVTSTSDNAMHILWLAQSMLSEMMFVISVLINQVPGVSFVEFYSKKQAGTSVFSSSVSVKLPFSLSLFLSGQTKRILFRVSSFCIDVAPKWFQVFV